MSNQRPSATKVGTHPGRVDFKRVASTTEKQIAKQAAQDAATAQRDAARHIRDIRLKCGFSQAEFARRINVSLATIRNWEQGKRSPTGAARALLRILDKAPAAAIAALS